MSADTATLTRPNCLEGLDLLHATFRRQTFSRHSHDGYALGVIESGALAFRYLRRDHTACAGEVNMVVPGECHDGRPAGPEGWSYRMFYLSPELVRDAARELELGLPDFRAGVLQDPGLAAAVRATHIRLDDPDACVLEKESRLLLLLTRWIHAHAERGGKPGPKGPERSAVRRAEEFLRARHADAPRLEEIANASGLSPFHMLRVFAESTGQTPHAYLTQLRVDRAKALLTTAMPLARIAAECGFSDQSHLTRLFRRQCGVTPGHFRKIVQNSGSRSA